MSTPSASRWPTYPTMPHIGRYLPFPMAPAARCRVPAAFVAGRFAVAADREALAEALPGADFATVLATGLATDFAAFFFAGFAFVFEAAAFAAGFGTPVFAAALRARKAATHPLRQCWGLALNASEPG